jgi:hypothetical protein
MIMRVHKVFKKRFPLKFGPKALHQALKSSREVLLALMGVLGSPTSFFFLGHFLKDPWPLVSENVLETL